MDSSGQSSRGGVKFAGNKDEEERVWYKRRVGFILYIKLSTLLGLTWVFGLVASIMDMPSLWYPFIILNSLQGTFIFVFFDLKWRVYYTAYEKLTGKSHPNRRRRKRKPSKLLKCLRPPEYVPAEPNQRPPKTSTWKSLSKEDSTEIKEDKKETQGFGKFKSKSILVKNALRLKAQMPSSPSKNTQDVEGLNAWEQLKIFQKSFSDANSAKEQELEENRQKRKGVITRQKGFEIEEDFAEDGRHYETLVRKKDPKRLLASTDSEESTMPRKRLKKKKRRSQRKKPDTADRMDLETLIPNCSESASIALPPPYRPPPKYRTLPRQVIFLGGIGWIFVAGLNDSDNDHQEDNVQPTQSSGRGKL